MQPHLEQSHREASNSTAPPTSRIGRFVIRELLGEGASGLVFLAEDPLLERPVALKIPRFADDDAMRSARFLREAKSTARLRHPAIVAVYEGGRAGGELYIASEYVAGRTLAQILEEGRSPRHTGVNDADAFPDFVSESVELKTNGARRNAGCTPFSIRQAVEWVIVLADALAYAHDEGVIHRDVKSGNIMIDATRRPRLMDFGVARLLHEESGLTADGNLVGTPAYMSPEQALGESQRAGPQSDLYSLGVVFYELLTGQLPFEGPAHEVIPRVLHDAPLPPRRINRGIPRDLEVICLTCLAKAPTERYPTCRELADDLQRWLRGDAISARPEAFWEPAWRWSRRHRLPAALVVAVVVLLAGIAAISSALAVSLSRDRTVKETLLAELTIQQEEETRQRDAAGVALREAKDRLRVAGEQAVIAGGHAREAEENSRLAEDALGKLEQEQARLEDLTGEHKAELARMGEIKRTAVDTGNKAQEALERSAAMLSDFRKKLKGSDPFTHYWSSLQFVIKAICDRNYDVARELLWDCDEKQRGWEWNYLHTRLVDAPVPGWTAADATIEYAAPPNNARGTIEAKYYDGRKHKYVSFSPDGKLLGCIDSGRQIKLLDAATGALIRTLTDKSRSARAAAAKGIPVEPFFAMEFSPGSRHVAALSRNRIVVWECSSGDVTSTAGASKAKRSLNEAGGPAWDGMGNCDNLAIAYGPNAQLLVAVWDREQSISRLVKDRVPGAKPYLQWDRYAISVWDGETGERLPVNKAGESLLKGLQHLNFKLSAADGLLYFGVPRTQTQFSWSRQGGAPKAGQPAPESVTCLDLKTGGFDMPEKWTWPFDVTEAHDRTGTRSIYPEGIWNVEEERSILPMNVLTEGLGPDLKEDPRWFAWSPDDERIALVIGTTVRVIYAPPPPQQMPTLPVSPASPD
jgi:hypothetical protein